MSALSLARSVTVGENGRMNLPADMRRKLGLTGGGKVFIEQDEDGIVKITTWAQRVAEIQARMAPYKRPGVSIVDELIADRRAENAKDEAEMREHEKYWRD